MALLTIACGERGDTCSGYEDSTGEAAAAAGQDANSSPSSCAAEGPGVTGCGDHEESCCSSSLVKGGSFYRVYSNQDGCSPQDQARLSTVSSFRLDNYAVTVGRFRQFVAAWNGGWRPEEGAGKHSYLNGGQGLNNRHSSPAYEPGWAVVDNDSVVLTTKKLTSCSGSNLTDDYQLIPYACSTWTEEPDVNERLPIVCVNWLEAYAFCIWDGAFLPSDAELEYAAAGGSQQRKYPWGPADPGQANQYAIVECSYPTSSICMSASKIAPVGSASLGAGRWGQFDLVGNVRQLSFDGTTAYPTKCTDCAELYRDSKSMRGGSFASDASQLAPAYSFDMDTTERRYDTGFRCARSP